jgi:hypothetical protein
MFGLKKNHLATLVTNIVPGVNAMITISCNFLPIFGEKVAFFSETNILIKRLHKLAVVGAKNANIFDEFFGKTILKIITSVPGFRVHFPFAFLDFRRRFELSTFCSRGKDLNPSSIY